ncbi:MULTISPECIES: hypothetical protein [Aphanothece]|uniref:tellurite resistance TerB family protein n=1 Tax=Aphanothece TaxID=1121 RepID=UPI00398EC988
MDNRQPDLSSLWEQNPEEGSSSQQALFRIVCWAAWSDGDLAAQERDLLAKVVAGLFPDEADQLQGEGAVQALAEFSLLTPRLESLVEALPSQAERQLAAKLVYVMLRAHQHAGDETAVTAEERHAYRRLLEVLKLPEALVEEAERQARSELASGISPTVLLQQALRHPMTAEDAPPSSSPLAL